jgi:Tfp pilus assembly protein PilO
MTGRDRIVAIAVGVLAVLAATWIMVVSPERKKASELDAQVSAAQTQLSSAEGQLANARAAQAQYASAYASIVSLGKAVPASQEVPSLIYQLAQASNNKKVEFASIVSGTAGGSGSSPSAAAASAAGFTQMPFTFTFNGSFFDLEHLFEQISRFTVTTSSGALQVSGRLLTIQSVKLAPLPSASAEPGKSSSSQLGGTITATAYVLPATQGLTGGATSASPAGAAAASTTGAASSPTPPAIARVTP